MFSLDDPMFFQWHVASMQELERRDAEQRTTALDRLCARVETQLKAIRGAHRSADLFMAAGELQLLIANEITPQIEDMAGRWARDWEDGQ